MTYEMVIARFSTKNKHEKVWFFEVTFFLADNSIVVVLKMFFLTFFNANIRFVDKKLK